LIPRRQWLSRLGLSLAAITTIISSVCPSALAISKQDLENSLPDNETVDKLAKTTVGMPYLDTLSSAASNLRDYQCFCQLFTVKNDKWKDYGGAYLSFKQRELLRAEIKSLDYRNGSVVVKQSDGAIRGKGGGTLSLVKMTLQPDSRTLKLPTGFSLAQSDFLSLSSSLKRQVAGGAVATVSAPVKLAPFKEPVLVLVMREKKGEEAIVGSSFVHVVYLSAKTKIPVAWNTYKDGHPNAFVFFDQLDFNKGLSDSLFTL
jgi:hypothetical protein